jgi:hypothetical protein
MQPPLSRPVEYITKQTIFKMGAGRYLVFVSPVSPLENGRLKPASTVWSTLTFSVVRNCLGPLELVEGRGAGLRKTGNSVTVQLSVDRRSGKLTNHVTVASDLPSEALDRPCHLVYLAVTPHRQ